MNFRSDIHTTTTTFGIGEPFVARCLLKTRPLFFIRVGSGACQLPISGVSWVTGEWTRRGERERAEPRPRASDSLQLKGRSKHRRDA